MAGVSRFVTRPGKLCRARLEFRLAVLLDGAFNHVTVDEEVLVLYGFALLDLAIGVYVLGGL
jgi:hypothetical protein